MDVEALASVLMPPMTKMFEAVTELNKDEINAELARLPDKPDEKLR
jgi:hypothetical protein